MNDMEKFTYWKMENMANITEDFEKEKEDEQTKPQSIKQ